MASQDLVGLVYNPRVPAALDFVRALSDSLGLQGRSWTSAAAEVGDVRDRLERTSVVVTAGGDGTILRTVRATAPYRVPIVGINMGRIGFMTELNVDEAADRLPEYLNGQLRVEERMMLEASVRHDDEAEPRLTLHALNDVVVGQGGVARLLDIDASVDGVPLTTYRADAVIVSTATGSTGYALSAGGPILYPEALMMLVQPVAPHTGLRDGLILPESSVIELSPGHDHHAMLSVDGFQDSALDDRDTVRVRRSPHVARFLRAQPARTFYTALTLRLGPVYRSMPSDERS